jgi:predicted RNA-binding Zn-ribbon protein involved in translation (DUF1610 family)
MVPITLVWRHTMSCFEFECDHCGKTMIEDGNGDFPEPVVFLCGDCGEKVEPIERKIRRDLEALTMVHGITRKQLMDIIGKLK